MEYGPENDDEKWSRKNYFEIPPCAKPFFGKSFLLKGGFLHQIANSVIKMTVFAHGGISIKLFVVCLHMINECLAKNFIHIQF